MSTILRVQWTIEPSAAPEPHLPCAQCRRITPFRASDKFRLNANGKRLDAWLIYRCQDCDGTWNRPIFERRPIGAIEPDLFARLQANDTELAAAIAFDGAELRRFTPRIAQDSAVTVAKLVVGVAEAWTSVAITMIVQRPVSIRLDRLLAGELGVSRERVKALVNGGHLRTERPGWRRAVVDRDCIVLDRVPDLWSDGLTGPTERFGRAWLG